MCRASLAPGLPDSNLYEELATLHGHYCPMSTLGLRLGWAVRDMLKVDGLRAAYHARTCAVDGLCLALGQADLPIENSGEHVLTLEADGRSWRVALRPETLTLAASYRDLSDPDQLTLLESLRRTPSVELFTTYIDEAAP